MIRVCLLTLAALALPAPALAHGAQEPATVEVTGEVLDLACFVSYGARGADNARCAAHHSSVSPIHTPNGARKGSSPWRSALIKEYFGRMTITSWPSLRSALGSEPTTSANPPVLTYGAHSEAMKAIFRLWDMGRSCE